MAKNPRQKLKLIYLMKIFLEKTDEKHSVTMKQIIEELERYNITAERKSIYDDIEALREYGLDIISIKGKNSSYYVANRRFQLPELKLLVDAVQGSKFITHRKSDELIKKVESFASIYEAQLLQRQVYVANRIKTMNESIYYNIDTLHEAISACKQISFLYYEWVVDFSCSEKIRKNLKRSGERYCLSPWALTWDDENYYLVAYDAEADAIKHFRVDKMSGINIMEESAQGLESFKKFDMAIYSRQVFGMFSGKEEMVQLVCANYLIGVIIDRFGKDIHISPHDEEHFFIAVRVMVSPQFMGWVMSFGGAVRIVAPAWVCDKISAQAGAIAAQYSQED